MSLLFRELFNDAVSYWGYVSSVIDEDDREILMEWCWQGNIHSHCHFIHKFPLFSQNMNKNYLREAPIKFIFIPERNRMCYIFKYYIFSQQIYYIYNTYYRPVAQCLYLLWIIAKTCFGHNLGHLPGDS